MTTETSTRWFITLVCNSLDEDPMAGLAERFAALLGQESNPASFRNDVQ
jgi:hypothetical protein